MDESEFFFELALLRFLEPDREEKPAAYCARCGRALQAWEFDFCGAAWKKGAAFCGVCAKNDRWKEGV